MAAGIVQIVVGIVVIVSGFRADAFYAAFIRRPRPDEKPMNKWLGRIIYIVVGLVFINAGILSLRHH